MQRVDRVALGLLPLNVLGVLGAALVDSGGAGLEPADRIALGALLVAALAFVVSSVISALAAHSAARSARLAEESVKTAREQVQLARDMRDEQEGPRFEPVTIAPAPTAGGWTIEATMASGPSLVDVLVAYEGHGYYQEGRVQRVVPLSSPLGAQHRQRASEGGTVSMQVIPVDDAEARVENVDLTVRLVCTEVLDIEDRRVSRMWLRRHMRTATRRSTS